MARLKPAPLGRTKRIVSERSTGVNAEPAKPRLLVLTSTFPRWLDDPEPAFVFELSRRLTAAFEVTVLAPRAPGSRRRETLDGVRVLRFPYFFSRWEHLATHGGASSAGCGPIG